MTSKRIDPSTQASELDLLLQYLDFQRETVLIKAEGLEQEQMARTLPFSSLTIAGLLNHLSLNEDAWLGERFLGLAPQEHWVEGDWEADPDWEFHSALTLQPDQLRERYCESGKRSRRIAMEATGLDQLSAQPLKSGEFFSLRWALLHLIEETARHAGHVDLLREAIDGVTGE